MECRECEVACSLYHEGECRPHLSRINVEFDDFLPRFPKVNICRQCDRPECYFACNSLHKKPAIYIDTKTGARSIDETICNGCGACAKSCPWMPELKIIGHKTVGGRRTYYKCDLCKDRDNGPLCVEICPSGALVFIPAKERDP